MKKSMKKARGVFEKIPGSDTWWIQFFDSAGHRRREKVGSKSAAMKLVELRRAQRTEGKKLPSNLRSAPIRFAELTDKALCYARAKGPADYPSKVSRMKPLLAEFGGRIAEEITPTEIENWLDEREEWAIATKNRYIALLKLIFKLAEKAQRLKYNPARLVRQQKENNARIRWLNDQEESAIRTVIQRDCPEHLPEFEIALHTGMRRSEQYGAVWDNVDLRNNVIRIPKSKHGEVRYVRLNSRSHAVLAMLKAPHSEGRIHEIKSPRSWFEPAVKNAKLKDFSWHCLRHTFISRLVMAGVDLRTVMELAGHKTIQMTMRYAHLAPGHAARAVEKLCEPSATPSATGELNASDRATEIVN